MEDQYKFKVIGAFVVGFAIVAGAYTLSNFGTSKFAKPIPRQEAAIAVAPARVLIDVVDTNTDGVEDWREVFFNENKPVVLQGNGTTTYEVPSTLTGQASIAVFQDIVRMKGLEGFGPTQEDLVAEAAAELGKYAEDELLDITDIKIGDDTSGEAVRAYANAAAQIILDYGLEKTVPELDSLRSATYHKDKDAIAELKRVATVYKTLLDKSRALVVPPQLIKPHLDVLNVYNALYEDIASMESSIEDPMAAFVRLKRYENDAEGLVYSVQNIYKAIEPYASYFERNDPAIFLVTFNFTVS
jgi:hypothetical protein